MLNAIGQNALIPCFGHLIWSHLQISIHLALLSTFWMLGYKSFVEEVLPNGILDIVSEYILFTLHLMLEELHWL